MFSNNMLMLHNYMFKLALMPYCRQGVILPIPPLAHMDMARQALSQSLNQC